MKPARTADSISCGLQPPSGPTSKARRCRPIAGDRRDWPRLDARRRLDEQQPSLGVVLQQPLGELDAVTDDRQHGPPALLGGRNRNAPPAIRGASVAEPVQANDGALGDHRLDAGGAHHRRVAHDLVHPVAFEDGLRQRQADGGLRCGADLLEQDADRRRRG